jgi:four helix bundle protein
MRYNHLPIFQLGYMLVIKIYQITHNFSREHKYSLGQKLKDTSVEFLDYIVMANAEENKTESLKSARISLERLRIHIRLANDLKIISLKAYEHLSRSLEDLSKQLSGWQEWSLKKRI